MYCGKQLTLGVFPMYVGVILLQKQALADKNSVPHVCGGDPDARGKVAALNQCSPCMWG